MKQTRTAKRREAAINSVKILLTSVSLAATVGGWAVISTSNGAAVNVAQANSTTAVQDFLASRSSTTVDSSAATAATAADTTGGSTTQNNSLTAASTIAAATVATNAAAPIATAAPTATAVPTQVIVQRTIRTRSSR